MIEHKETCLVINDKQIVKLERGWIKFKNHFKQLAVPFKTHADFEYFLKGVSGSDKTNNTSWFVEISKTKRTVSMWIYGQF